MRGAHKEERQGKRGEERQQNRRNGEGEERGEGEGGGIAVGANIRILGYRIRGKSTSMVPHCKGGWGRYKASRCCRACRSAAHVSAHIRAPGPYSSAPSPSHPTPPPPHSQMSKQREGMGGSCASKSIEFSRPGRAGPSNKRTVGRENSVSQGGKPRLSKSMSHMAPDSVRVDASARPLPDGLLSAGPPSCSAYRWADACIAIEHGVWRAGGCHACTRPLLRGNAQQSQTPSLTRDERTWVRSSGHQNPVEAPPLHAAVPGSSAPLLGQSQ